MGILGILGILGISGISRTLGILGILGAPPTPNASILAAGLGGDVDLPYGALHRLALLAARGSLKWSYFKTPLNIFFNIPLGSM